MDYNGYYGIRNLISIFNQSIGVIQKIIELIANTCAKEAEALKKSVKILFNKSKKQIKLLDNVVKQSTKLAKRLGAVGTAISFITILYGFVNAINKGVKIIYAVAKALAEIFTELLIMLGAKICGKIAKSAPGFGFVLDVLVSLGVSYLLSKYFTDKRVSKIADSIYFTVKNRNNINYKTLFKILFKGAFA